MHRADVETCCFPSVSKRRLAGDRHSARANMHMPDWPLKPKGGGGVYVNARVVMTQYGAAYIKKPYSRNHTVREAPALAARDRTQTANPAVDLLILTPVSRHRYGSAVLQHLQICR